ncbi:hypothetical protein [Clostridium sp.]|jgi:hypothetical protein|uniref:hypothetical protein n=1 Tax=Clostridium sp. TaxID=1506 RepID=UPI003EED5835
MKNKVMVLVIAGILTVGGVSVAYGTVKNNDNKSSYNYTNSMMDDHNGQARSNGSYNDMIKIMNDNGFSDEAKAIENRDFDSMNDIMNNISDDDYKKMINIMEENEYESMGNMMETIGREDSTELHESMMGR